MAVITQQFLAAVFTNFVATFQTIFTQSTVGVPEFCEEVTSTTEMESYNWLGSGPRMRQWTDEREPNGATSNNFAIRNLDWEASVEIDRDTFEDDKLHLVKPLIAGLLVTAYILDHSWFVVHTGNPGARPFIFQWRKKPQMTQLTNPNTSEAVWRRKKFFYGADSRYNVGYGNFAYAVGSSVA